MGVILHSVAYDVGNLVETSVVESLHRVKDTPLHGFEAVVDMRHGTLKYDIGGILEKPALIHAAQLMLNHIARSGVWFLAVFTLCRLLPGCKIVEFLVGALVIYIVAHWSKACFTHKVTI